MFFILKLLYAEYASLGLDSLVQTFIIYIKPLQFYELDSFYFKTLEIEIVQEVILNVMETRSNFHYVETMFQIFNAQ